MALFRRNEHFRPNPFTPICGALIAITQLSVGVPSVRAWENTQGHRAIVDRAIYIVKREYPGQFLELEAFNQIIQDGAYSEDLPPEQVLKHFYNPITDRKNSGLLIYYIRTIPHIGTLEQPVQVPGFVQSANCTSSAILAIFSA